MACSKLDHKLVNCATLEPEQAIVLWEELLKEVPLDDFSYQQQRLLPLIWMNLKKTELPFSDEPRLKGTYRRSWIKNSILQKSCLEALKVLAEHEIPTMVLKAMAFEPMLYANKGVRVAGDFDLLVPFQQINKAIDCLTKSGWEIDNNYSDPGDRIENELSLTKDQVKLDLHYFLLREARLPNSDQALWAEARPLEVAGYPALTLSPTHHLFHLIVSADRESDSVNRYLVDLFFLKKFYADELDPNRVVKMLRERHLLSRLKNLPLETRESLGFSSLPSLTALDKVWSQATRCVFDAPHEWHYLAFPLLDYWIHFRGSSSPNLSLSTYLIRQLKIKSPQDFIKRTIAKLWRMAKEAVRGRC